MGSGIQFALEEWRNELFTLNLHLLTSMALETRQNGVDLAECLFLCVDADDDNWTDLATQLTPKQNWEELRQNNQAAVALGCVDMDDAVGIILHHYPECAHELLVPPCSPHVRIIILSRGISIFDIEIPDETYVRPQGTTLQ